MKNQVTKNIEDPIFSSEQAHLTEVYGKLSARKAAIEKELKTLRKEAAEEKILSVMIFSMTSSGLRNRRKRSSSLKR